MEPPLCRDVGPSLAWDRCLQGLREICNKRDPHIVHIRDVQFFVHPSHVNITARKVSCFIADIIVSDTGSMHASDDGAWRYLVG